MSSYHRYVPDKGKALPLFLQWLREFFYLLEYLFYAVLGIFVSLPAAVADNEQGHEEPRQKPKPSVILISGLMGRPLAFWRMRRALLKKGYNVHAPSFGFQIGFPSKKAARLDRYLDAHNIEDAYLVGHSMGGLIALNISLTSVARVRKLFLLGSPLKGARAGYPFFFVPAISEMLPGAKFLISLEKKKASFIALQSIFPTADEIIWQPQSCASGGMDDIELQEVGHFNLAMGPNGIDCLLLLLEEDNQRGQADSQKIKALRAKQSAAAKASSSRRSPIQKTAEPRRSQQNKSTKKTSDKKKQTSSSNNQRNSSKTNKKSGGRK